MRDGIQRFVAKFGPVIAAALAIVTTAPAVADEECIFDQEAQITRYHEMERRIPGARFDPVEELLIIERGAATITLGRGGCVHLGLYIVYEGPAAPGDAERDAVFARAVALVDEFGGGELVTAAEVAAAIREEAFALVDGRLYYLRLPNVTAFSIMWDIEDGRLTVEVGYYI
jgi:hypothetical protein